jgi:hypothetical protein
MGDAVPLGSLAPRRDGGFIAGTQAASPSSILPPAPTNPSPIPSRTGPAIASTAATFCWRIVYVRHGLRRRRRFTVPRLKPFSG